MNTTPATPPPPPVSGPQIVTADVPPRFPVLLMLIVWLAVVLVATLVTFMLPEYYVSTTRIKIGPDQPDIRALSKQPGVTNGVDPDFLQTELETIQSEAVLGRVIAELDLNAVWGKKYLDGGKLKTSETLAILRGRLDIRRVRNTSLLDIRAFSENPNEARAIANATAKAYQQWRLDAFRERTIAGLKSLEERAKLTDEKIAWAIQRLEKTANSGGTQNLAYVEQQKQLGELTDFRSELATRIRREETDLHLPRSRQVMILESAKASAAPFRPNKSFNIILGIILGALAGFLLAVLVYAIKRWSQQRHSGNSGTNTLRGLRTFIQTSVALLVGILVGYHCAMPLSRASLFFMLLFVVLGALAIGYVAVAKTTPLPPRVDGSPITV